jgi:hypothetical protein
MDDASWDTVIFWLVMVPAGVLMCLVYAMALFILSPVIVPVLVYRRMKRGRWS